MATSRAIPIVVGVGDVINRSVKIEDALEPVELMHRSIQKALEDTGLSKSAILELQNSIDSIDVVACWTWPYPDAPGLLSTRLGVTPQHKATTPNGGNHPVKMVDEAARRVSLGQSKVAVVTGGEALASLSACAAQDKLPPPGWTDVGRNVDSVFSPTTRDLGTDLGAVHSIGAPIQVYPLYENAFRASRGQSLEENHKESARLYAHFAQVAAQNPLAWNYGKPPQTEQSIGSVTSKNRMICLPYPLLMNAFNNVNIAGTCLLTSTEYATQLGIPKSRWIYPLAGAGTKDASHFWKRPNFYSSPSISRSLDAGLESSGLSKEQIDMFDFYSCFPIVPKLACHHLGLPFVGGKKPITLLGGLTSFGGAGNNYSMHAITEMVRQLRNGNGRNGLILANGGVVSYQHVICLSSQPRKDGSPYPEKDPLPEYLSDEPVPVVDANAEGEAFIETYTVDFNRDGTPSMAHIVGRLKSNNHRFLANDADSSTLEELSSRSKEPIGRSGWVKRDPKDEERNLFSFSGGHSRL